MAAFLVGMATAACEGAAEDLIAGLRKECRGCDLQGVSFKKADLTGVDLTGANLTDACTASRHSERCGAGWSDRGGHQFQSGRRHAGQFQGR